jgi:hypothetical protein
VTGRDERRPIAGPTAAAATSMATDALTAKVVELFADAGLPSVLLRGAAIVDWLYSPSTRTYTDVDLLVRPRDVVRAEAILARAGFRLLPLPPLDEHARTWVRGDGEPAVDLHTTLYGIAAAPDDVWRAVAGSTRTLVVGGRETAIPSRTTLAFEVALHASQHGRQLAHPLNDLTRALERATLQTWKEAAALADELDALPAFAAGLRSITAGAAIADRLDLPRRRSAEMILRSDDPPNMAIGLEWLATRPSVWGKTRFLFAKMFPGPAFMRAWSPTRTKSRLGLAAAYLLRLAWIIRHAGPAVWAWRRARREARWQRDS